MPTLTNGSPGRLTIALLGATLVVAFSVPAMAKPSGRRNTGSSLFRKSMV